MRQVMEEKQGIWKPFMKLAAVILSSWNRGSGKSKWDPMLVHDLRILYPKQELKQAQWEFRVKRLGMTLAVLCMGAVCTLWLLSNELSAETEVSGNGILRGAYGEGERHVQLEIRYGEYEAQLEIPVGARVYNKEDIELLSEEFRRKLPELILLENEDLDRVQGDLYLAEEYEGFPFMVSWYSTAPEYMERTGRLAGQVSEPTVVELQAVFSHEEWEWEYRQEITILPGETGYDEGWKEKKLMNYLSESEKDSRHREWWTPPSHWEGQELIYSVSKRYLSPGVFLLFIVAAVLVFIFARKDLHQKYLDRQQELKADYSELLHQLILYLGAGLTIRGSLHKIAEAYENSQEAGECSRAAFEEVGYVCRELATGVSEIHAYENWSRRTGLAEYTQLCTLLAQNLQKGSNGLTQRLREEGEHARKEYLRHCKKKSEEAQTRLLLPLVLMLVVVMLLILIPAFSMAGI